MHTKLIMVCMAFAAFAFVAAPAASASPALTASGVLAPIGTAIEGKSTGGARFTGSFSIECSSATLTGTLTKNSGTKIEGTIPVGKATYTGTGTSGDCTSALGSFKVTMNSELCLVSGTTDNLIVIGCGVNPVIFTLEFTGTGSCKYSTAVVSGTFTTNVTPPTLSVSEQEAKKVEGGFFCPAFGKLDMDFDLYADGTNFGLAIS